MSAFVLPALAVLASLSQTSAEPLIGARSLALSHDGKQLAFSYRGDIWVCSAEGGRATAITSNVEMDDNPVWSPDGKWIAFASTRTGNSDIFIVGVEGGTPRRITWNSGSDVPSDWSPDGKNILLRATRDRPYNGIFEINVTSGAFRPVFYDPNTVGNPKYSPDGNQIVYTRLGFPWNRPRYQGSAASQLWIYDRATATRSKVRDNGFQHLWPQWTPSGIVTVTMTQKTANSGRLNEPLPILSFNAAQTPNVHLFDRSGRGRAITEFPADGTRYATASRDADMVAFERDGSVYTMSRRGNPTKITIVGHTDEKGITEERLVLTGEASDANLSPNGETMLFTTRGEIWTVPIKRGTGPNKDDATQITRWAGSDDQGMWTPDGKAIFFVSDRDGAERLYRMDMATQAVTAITTVDADVTFLMLTPDKKHVSFWMAGKQGGLYTVPVEGGSAKLVFSRPGARSFDYSWSPDGKYFAYSEVLPNSGQYYWESGSNIHIVEAATAKATNVTQLNVLHSTPRWSPDGKYLYFGSSRNAGGIQILPLQREELDADELQLEYKKPTGDVKVTIDFEDIETRWRPFAPVPIDAFGSGLVIDPENGTLYAVVGGDLYRVNYAGDNVARITTGAGISGLALSQDGKNLEFVSNGVPTLLELRKNGMPIKPVTFRADWTRDVLAERVAAFNEFYRLYNRGFYDPAFHGRDWLAVNKKYQKFIPSIGHRSEMATVLNMIIGEVEASHTEVGAAPGGNPSASSAHLGFFMDFSYTGQGIKVLEVPNRTPGSFTKSKLNPGDIIVKINGKDVNPSEALYRDVLNEQSGREITLSVKNATGMTRDVKYRALSSGEFGGIVNQNLLQWRRKYVEEKSGGKVSYVHIAGMSGPELQRFNQQVWQVKEGKSGMIIDVRGNGGGNTSDQIIDILERRQNSVYVPRDDRPIRGPGTVLDIPIVVMCNFTSFSNAEMFPYAMRQRGLAKLVGTPTPGYVIYTNGGRLIDGTSIRMPNTGVYRMDGSNLENDGVVPDYVLDVSPEDFFAGRDPQLDKAVEVVLKGAK